MNIDAKNQMIYSLLRRVIDERPLWAVNIGLHSVCINERIIENPYPRLRHKRSGSFITSPYSTNADRDIKAFEERLEELLEKVSEYKI